MENTKYSMNLHAYAHPGSKEYSSIEQLILISVHIRRYSRHCTIPHPHLSSSPKPHRFRFDLHLISHFLSRFMNHLYCEKGNWKSVDPFFLNSTVDSGMFRLQSSIHQILKFGCVHYETIS